MPRSMTTAMLAACGSPAFAPTLFVEIGFVSGPVYLWSGMGRIVWNGNTWVGRGSLLSIGQQIEDGATVEARGITITLSGLDAALLSSIEGEVQLGLPLIIWLGAMAGGAVVADPVMLWSGGVDQPTIEVDGQMAEIRLNGENLLVMQNVPVERRYTIQDQQQDWPGDLGFLFVDSIQEQTIYWGLQANSTDRI